MTVAGDGRDPLLQAAVDRAVRDLAARLRPFTTGMADPDGFAARYVEDLYGGSDHWRPVPRSTRIPDQTTHGDPPNPEFRKVAAKIRGEADA